MKSFAIVAVALLSCEHPRGEDFATPSAPADCVDLGRQYRKLLEPCHSECGERLSGAGPEERLYCRMRCGDAPEVERFRAAAVAGGCRL